MDSIAANLPAAHAGRRLRLVRYFTFTSLVMFVAVAAALVLLLARQGDFLRGVQQRQVEFFAGVQKTFARQQDDASRRDLLAVHEAGNVNLTRLFANTLWLNDFEPFVNQTSTIPVDSCRAIADVVDPKDGKPKAPPEKKACFAAVGERIAALPGYDALHAKVFDVMKKTTVFKIKVFDLRGVTVYSSERAQLGEDKSTNAGWRRAAVDGVATSELTHRDKFSAFEGVVEKRDLISSYLPVLAPGSGAIVGVFEVYSDVTPFLAQIKATSEAIAKNAATNEAQVRSAAAASEDEIALLGRETLAVVLGLLVLLFGALFWLVRRADRVMAQQEREREASQQQLAQSEKMASLGQMVAGIAHQLNTPLAFTHNNVSMVMDALRAYELPLLVAGKFSRLVRDAEGAKLTLNIGRARKRLAQIDEHDLDVQMPTEMLSDTLQGLEQMRELVQNLRDFTRLDRSKTAHVDLNRSLGNVCYIARSVIPSTVQLVQDLQPLPEIECNPSQLNQVFLNLINNAAQAIGSAAEGTVTVRSRPDRDGIVIEVADTGSGIPPDVLPHIWDTYYTTKPAGEGTGLGLPIARSIVQEHGGTINVATEVGRGTTFTVRLPAVVAPEVAAAVPAPRRAAVVVETREREVKMS
jgi:signal transduction histidine kinase